MLDLISDNTVFLKEDVFEENDEFEEALELYSA